MIAARSAVEQGLATYPNDVRLVQLLATLNKGIGESRRRSLEELKHLTRDASTITDPVLLQTNLERARSIASQHSGDEEFQTLTLAIEQRQMNLTATFSAPPGVAASQRRPTQRRQEHPPNRPWKVLRFRRHQCNLQAIFLQSRKEKSLELSLTGRQGRGLNASMRQGSPKSQLPRQGRRSAAEVLKMKFPQESWQPHPQSNECSHGSAPLPVS